MNSFFWPGPDIRPIPGLPRQAWEYGLLPRGFYDAVMERLKALRRATHLRVVQRTE